jgi:hypothetical protein
MKAIITGAVLINTAFCIGCFAKGVKEYQVDKTTSKLNISIAQGIMAAILVFLAYKSLKN